MVILLDLLFLDPNCSRNIQAFVYFSKTVFATQPLSFCVQMKIWEPSVPGAVFAMDNVQALYAQG